MQGLVYFYEGRPKSISCAIEAEMLIGAGFEVRHNGELISGFDIETGKPIYKNKPGAKPIPPNAQSQYKPRKIIQISTTMGRVFALCDDGSVWLNAPDGWQKSKDIPQD